MPVERLDPAVRANSCRTDASKPRPQGSLLEPAFSPAKFAEAIQNDPMKTSMPYPHTPEIQTAGYQRLPQTTRSSRLKVCGFP